MGIYIGLDIIPNHIRREDWEIVFDETLKLVQSYPFAALNVEEINGFKRLALDRAKEQYTDRNTERYWKIDGDLESKKTGESFTLYSNIERYNELSEETLNEDILLCQTEDGFLGAAREVFYEKTQGFPYHIPMLAIASLIESRFPKYASVYGNFTKEQAQKAVDWANSILDKPVGLPVRVVPSNLLVRLKGMEPEERRLEFFYDLFIGDSDEVDSLVAKHFKAEAVEKYFMKRLKNYNSAHQLGALNIMIQCLNIGLPLENLVHICCFDKNGPMFKHDDFTEALCSTWVFIDPKARGYMDPIKTPEDQPDSVESQIGNIFLDMGFMGRHTRRFIPKDEVLEVLKEKFQDAEIEGIVNTEFQEIVETLDMAGDELKKLEEEYAVNVNKNEMDTFDELLRWDDTFIISEEIMKVILAIKGSVDKILSRKDSQSIQMIEEIDSKDQLIYLLSKLVQEHHNLVLTRAAWDWIENEDRNVIKRMIAMMLLKTGNNVEIRKLFKAMLENKSLFYKYMK